MSVETHPPLDSAGHATQALGADPLSLLLESTGEGIFGIDLDGNCTFINRAGARMLGWDSDEVLRRNMHELTHHSHPDGRHYPVKDCPIFNAFREARPCRIDAEVFWRRDGSAFAVEYSSYPILDGAQVRGAVVTFVDITARRADAQALYKAKEELEQRVSERTAELSAALGQLRELAAWSEEVREDERTRIAREVHDELGSLLVALKMDVNWLDKRLGEQEARTREAAQDMRQRMRGKCQNMSRLIETAVDNVGRIITDLRPSILDHQGLWAALEWLAHDLLPAAELALDWQMALPDGLELPEAEAMAVFRIFQEMLSNVMRHAGAAGVTVRIAVEDGWLSLSVRDDGRGAQPQAFEAHDAYGVMGMRERARHFGGRLEILSRVGQGTLCSLFWPLPVADSAS
ncbi:MAG: PAS domain-containing sensor histidine kinase [Burkholderiaceae bacterium]